MTSKKIQNLSNLTAPAAAGLASFIAYFMKKPWIVSPFGSSTPQRIAIIPLDLNLADPALAHEFYHGRFALAGRIVRTGAISPWQIVPPTQKWEEELHDFSWLRHMGAAKTAIASAHSRILVDEWISLANKKKGRCAWEIKIVARRIISWLSHADMLLVDAPVSFQRKFLKNLGRNIRYLRRLRPFIGKRAQRGALETALALCFANLALPCSPAQLRKNEAHLEQTLKQHILADGGHMSRNPAALIPILADLVALCHGYQQANRPIPALFLDILERIDQALRFFQHRDQSLANFNGVGPLLPERLNKLLNIHAITTPPPAQLEESGYQRLACGATTLIIDTGCPPQGRNKPWSTTAHAGCLSFEMSSGAHRFIVNCGVDPNSDDSFPYFGRITAAHSTATLNDTSSCRFRHVGQADTPLIDGPDRVRLKQIEQAACFGFVACHNGYGKAFNMLHQRSMALSRDGNLLQGADRFIKLDPKREMGQTLATVRFHLHPDVEVSQLENRSLRLEVMRADVWLLSCQAEMVLEESIYFCSLAGPTRTRQIVFHFDPAKTSEIYWAFQRQVPSRLRNH